MTHLDFFEAYKNGQRKFNGLDFEYLDGFSEKDFSNIEFENCFLYIDFRKSNLSNAKFISCNLKEIDLRETNLTNAFMKNCLIESAMFKDAKTNGFVFQDNYYFGHTLKQKDFDTELINSNSQILSQELNKQEYLSTMGDKMFNVTETAQPIIDIWSFANHLVYEKIINEYVYENQLVENVYRNNTNTFDHILIPTEKPEFFTVIIVDLTKAEIKGYYKLDLKEEYGLS